MKRGHHITITHGVEPAEGLDEHGATDPEVPPTYAAGADHELAFWEALWSG